MQARLHIADESGQTMAEYAVVLCVMITVVMVLAFSFLSGAISHTINTVGSLIP
jgi:Flp pilus assembly pilin Flp